MFYYISFLRPPPFTCPLTPIPSKNPTKGKSTSKHQPTHKSKDTTGKSPSSSAALVHITPQICNDLRTETYGDPAGHDIYYAWLKCAVPGASAGPATPPAKLTTYRAADAYKALPVPAPRGAAPGERWRLALWSERGGRPPSHPRVAVDLCGAALGAVPLPVLSEPIVFGGAAGAEKQGRISRVYRLGSCAGGEKDSLLTVTEQTGYALEKKIWDSGIGLSSWICELASSHGNSEAELVRSMRDTLLGPGKRRFVELGAGTGIVSLTITALRQALQRKRLLRLPKEACTDDAEASIEEEADQIFITDLPSAIPLLEENIAQNAHLFAAHHNSAPDPAPPSDVQAQTIEPALHAMELDWDKPEIPRPISSGGALDAIIMADVTYNSDVFPELVSTVKSLIALTPASTPPPMVLLGYKQRHPDERVLWDMVQREAGVRLIRVGERRGSPRPPEEITGHGEGEVEVWIGRVEKQPDSA